MACCNTFKAATEVTQIPQQHPREEDGEKITGMWGSVAEVLFGEQQQGFAVHLERSAGDGPQGELLLSPAQPLGHVVPAPEDGLQACRREREDAEGGGKEGRKGGRGEGETRRSERQKDAGVGEARKEGRGKTGRRRRRQ